jgi:UDPglucose 6-dehydrogenase
MTPWPEFAQIDLRTLALRGRLLIDPYGLLDGARARALGFTYFKLGASPEERSAA